MKPQDIIIKYPKIKHLHEIPKMLSIKIKGWRIKEGILNQKHRNVLIHTGPKTSSNK